MIEIWWLQGVVIRSEVLLYRTSWSQISTFMIPENIKCSPVAVSTSIIGTLVAALLTKRFYFQPPMCLSTVVSPPTLLTKRTQSQVRHDSAHTPGSTQCSGFSALECCALPADAPVGVCWVCPNGIRDEPLKNFALSLRPSIGSKFLSAQIALALLLVAEFVEYVSTTFQHKQRAQVKNRNQTAGSE